MAALGRAATPRPSTEDTSPGTVVAVPSSLPIRLLPA